MASIAPAHPDDAPGAPTFVLDQSDPASLPPFAEPLEPAPPREPTPPPAPVRGPRPSHEQGALAVAKGVAVKHSFAPSVQPGAVAMWPRSTLSFVVAQHTLRDRARHWLVEVGAEGTVLRTAGWPEPLRAEGVDVSNDDSVLAVGVGSDGVARLFIYDASLRLRHQRRVASAIAGATVKALGSLAVVVSSDGDSSTLSAFDVRSGKQVAARVYPARFALDRGVEADAEHLYAATYGPLREVVQFDAGLVPVRRHGHHAPQDDVGNFERGEPMVLAWSRVAVFPEAIYTFDRELQVEARLPADPHLAAPWARNMSGRVLTARGFGAAELGQPLTEQVRFDVQELVDSAGLRHVANEPVAAFSWVHEFFLLTRTPCLRITSVRYPE